MENLKIEQELSLVEHNEKFTEIIIVIYFQQVQEEM